MDSEETTTSASTKKQKRVLSSLALRFCTVIVFSIISFVVLSFLLGVLVIFIGELWVYSSSAASASASLHSRCKIVSSSVDLRSSKVCGIGLLNTKAQHVFYPFERDKFRCRYDYYWASVFKVEYKDNLMGQTRLAFSEAPNEALPPECRPNFGAAMLTKDNFKVNETYDCWYTLGIPKIKLYRDSFFGCQANDLSFTDIVKNYSIVISKLVQSWLNGEATPKYWKFDVIAGIVSGFATSIITVFIVRILRHAKSWFPQACCSVKNQFSNVNLLIQVKRACLVLVYFSVLGWMAQQYLKILFPKA
ncbi:hypothetical protein CARUB_v10005338mg [Capsella rubella]|uniref:Uncharacterized protein n=1 Tax=Capsella rubella TaxID=81985 RepID=R0H0W6_9BRAS|nr:uncharacterized protein LOC17878078 [Capsella rubella]EOA17088.1 hypothetical protein CARUB_v10005338mg [Capsella rubella]